jgi:hypothetical protein
LLQGAPVTAIRRELKMTQDGWGKVYRACRRGAFHGGRKACPADHQERALFSHAQPAMLPAAQAVWLARCGLGGKGKSRDPEFIGCCV